ncbi:MAG: hypothetical protein AAGC88_15645, partial [Bacteroidota bacterium]
YRLSNQTSSVIDTLYLNLPDFTSYDEVHWNGQQVHPSWVDLPLNLQTLALKIPAETNGILKIKGSRIHTGFTQDKHTQQPEITFNGSFLHAQDLLPTLGYKQDNELQENRYRSDWGLEKIDSRMSAISNPIALTEDVFSPDATWLSGTIELSTSADQVAVAPGKLIKSWQAEDRNHYRYHLDSPAPFEWYIGSAQYQQVSFNHDGIQSHIYFKPEHDYNISFFKKSVENALTFIQSSLGNYPYPEFKLIEIPYYQEPHYAYPNTIAISEKEGWYADTTSLQNQVYIEFTIASNLLGHWVMQNIPIANVQGANMLRHALPESMAMQIIEDQYGQEGIEWLLTKKQGLYARERGTEPNVEPPLIKADGIAYLESNKGTIELYRLSRLMGQEAFIQTIKDWAEGLNENATFFDLYSMLLKDEAIANIPKEEIQIVKKAFEEVTL